MSIEGWQYYNHARIPTAPPTVPAALEAMAEEGFWHDSRGTVLLARWTSEFDCRRETGWWYIIKDTPLDMDAMKAKRRYEITKGQKHFQVRPIVPKEYGQALYRVEQAAFAAYPAKYRPQVDWDTFAAGLPNWEDCLVYGAFSRETGELAGYGLLRYAAPDFLDFLVLEADPAWEKQGVNAAIVAGILEENRDFLQRGGILCDGARSIRHETNFQDYLEKYFGFRRAYCVLHLAYPPKIRWAVRAAYPFRRLLAKLDGIGVVHQLNGVLKMEEIVKGEQK